MHYIVSTDLTLPLLQMSFYTYLPKGPLSPHLYLSFGWRNAQVVANLKGMLVQPTVNQPENQSNRFGITFNIQRHSLKQTSTRVHKPTILNIISCSRDEFWDYFEISHTKLMRERRKD